MAKGDSRDEDSFLDEEIDDDEWDEEENEYDEDAADEEEESDDEEEGGNGEEEEDAKSEEAGESAEEEIDYPPDDEKAVAALRKMQVRLDSNDRGNVWRVIFDDTNGKDQSLVLLKGLPALRELWTIGTHVTSVAVAEFKEERPKVTVYD